MDNFQIVTEHNDMLKYIDFLQKKNAESLSFYPMQVFEREQKNKRLFLGLLNNQPCGYIYVGANGADVKCHQVCVQYDLRNRYYGACLVGALENYAYYANTITLRCGFDLDANNFWAALGYRVINIVDGGIRRNRKINIWQKSKNEAIELLSIEPAIGKTDNSIWVKNKKTGIVSSFSRGAALANYRSIVVGGKNIITNIENIDVFEQMDIFGNNWDKNEKQI